MDRLNSGAPSAGGATTVHSRFGGSGWEAAALRMIARAGRRITGFAYRRLREMDGRSDVNGAAGRPNRVTLHR
jgi:hypothetical protein